jgi:hypothetical protein
VQHQRELSREQQRARHRAHGEAGSGPRRHGEPAVTQRAASQVMPIITGSSSSSAVRSPTRGTRKRMRSGPSTKPAPKVSAK